jgi:hypothetical protein
VNMVSVWPCPILHWRGSGTYPPNCITYKLKLCLDVVRFVSRICEDGVSVVIVWCYNGENMV